FFAGDLLPENFTGCPVKAHDDELNGVGGRADVGAEAAAATAGGRGGGRRRRGRAVGFFAGGHRRLDENLVAPDNGRSRAVPGYFDLPFDVLSFAPGSGRIGKRSDAVGEGTAPLRPICRIVRE